MSEKYYGAAAEYHKPTGGVPAFNPRIFIVIGLVVGLLVVLGIGYSFISSLSQGPQQDYTSLVARETALQALIDKQKTNIKSDDLKTINTNANMLLLTNLNTLNGLLKSQFGLDAVPETVTATEADPTTDTTLQTAQLGGTFDQAYIAALQNKVASGLQLAQKVEGESSGAKLKAALESLKVTLNSISDSLSKVQL
jgi:hypothetical protein